MTPEDLKTVYKQIFATDEGKIVLNDLAQRCHFFGITFAESTNEVIYKEGQRSVVLFLNNMIKDTPPPTQETAEEE